MRESLVSAVKCADYEEKSVAAAFDGLLEGLGGLSFIKPGMTVAIKVNLVSAMKPHRAATTHPALVSELCRRIVEAGATPVVGDSPGGPFTGMYLNGVYSATGMNAVEKAGGRLNRDFDVDMCTFPEGEVMKEFSCSSWLLRADCVINFAKLKTHGMMGMSAAVKNLFGAIPGIIKPEYHYRFPNSRDFASMLVDIDEFIAPALSIVDGVVGMEGNGPTMGKARQIGVLAASASPYALDLYCAGVIGLSEGNVPTLQVAAERGLAPDGITVAGDAADVKISDYENVERSNDIEFVLGLSGFKGKFINKFTRAALSTRPKLKGSECVGCRKCEGICPAKAITMKRSRPHIDRDVCIRCFCCQEFCPKGALKVYRPVIARIMTKSGAKKKKRAGDNK